ncbi:PfkB family carbohydrate kinase, partial [Vineibacter terrae]|uniref:PfkB family carbohydrate kinase n=1 Tax=Vineibacter terrae TaxID=2586908 RepID=UPI002E3536D4
VTDILVVNETELAAISGTPVGAASTADDIAAAARPLARDGRAVVATLGARGALAVDRDGVHAITGHAVTVVDTTGAGDCFVGALAASLAAGSGLRPALARACAAAALSVQRLGAAPSMPTSAALHESGLCPH